MTDRRMRLRAAAGLLALVALTSCAAPQDDVDEARSTTSKERAPAPTTSVESGPNGPNGPNGTIVFDANFSTGPELHAVDVDAVSDRRIGGDASGHGPRISPDGRTLAYTRSATPEADPADVYVLDLVTDQERKIGPGGCPTWTTDGEALIVYRPEGLQRLELDGTATTVEGGDESCALEVGPGRFVLWGQDDSLELLDKGQRRTLLRQPDCGIGPVDVDATLARIAYSVVCGPGDGSSAGLWVMDLETREAERVMEGQLYGAAWSPDDAWIATTRTDVRPDGSSRQDLWIACPDTCEQRRIFEGGVNNPTWGPTPAGGSTPVAVR